MTDYTSTARRIWALLTLRERKRGAALFGLLIVGMVFETLSVGLVIPAVALLVQTDLPARYPRVQDALTALGNPSHSQLVVAGMLALVGIYVVKTAFLAWLAWYQNRLAFGIQQRISEELFATYLRQPYTFHLQRNSAQLIRNTVNEVHQLWFLMLNPALVVLSEGLVLLGITCLLLIVEPVGALIVVVVLGGAAWGFDRYFRVRLVRLGAERQHHDGLRIQQLQQGFGGVKEIKMLGREADFVAKYARHNAASARVERYQATLQLLPRLWIEMLAMAALATLVMTMLARGRDTAAIVPMLGLFAAAAFRVMPSAYRILGAIQNLPYGAPVIETLYNELRLAPAPQHRTGRGRQQPALAFQREIEMAHVEYIYPGATAPAVSDLTITIRKGECVGFVGPSGSGKTTLVDLVLGLLTPTAGQVAVDGADIQAGLRAWQDQIGYVPQSVYLTDDTIRNNVAFGVPADQVDEAAVARAIAAARLDAFVASLDDGLATLVGERGVRLSGGQRQRIGIARAMYHDPAVLVLDEATSSLDGNTEQGIVQAVAALQGSTTVLIVSHRLSTVARCSRLYRLNRGSVTAEGAPSELLREEPTV